MALELHATSGGKVLAVEVRGKLTHADYESCVAEFERLLKEHGKLRVLYDLVNFHGWEMAALWDEIKFDVKHLSDIERLAVIADKTWKKWLAEFCKPFTRATIRCFDQGQAAAAREWLAEP